jgi:3',5'-nucleoside bisphosphate phosphatase
MNETRLIDLHLHSTASDGSYTPKELVELADSLNLGAIALTDHDTLSGLPEFIEHAEKFPGIIPISGVEISVDFAGRELHIVGLFINHNCQPLETMLCEIRKNRNARNELIVKKLQEMDYDITIQEVLDIAGGESIGRPLFAKILIEKGYFSEPQDVFDQCLKRGAPAYCSRILPSPKEAIDAIHEAGGLAIWAHPLHRSQTDRSYLRKVLKELITFNIDGIEAYYTSFTNSQTKAITEVAYEFSISLSGGTDFHGSNQIGIFMGSGRGGLKIPFSVYESLYGLSQKRKNF